MDFAESYFNKLFDEEAFIGSERATVASGGGTFNVHISNPSDSGKLFLIDTVDVESQGDADITVYDSFSSDPSGGNNVSIDNMFLDPDNGTPDEGVADINSDVSFTAASDGEHSKHVAGSGQGVQQVAGTARTGSIGLAHGRDLVIEIVNDTSTDFDAAITIVYFQKSIS